MSVLGLGTWAFGGPDWPYGWGPQDERDSERTVHRALSLGINWIDTAPVYGLGAAEELLRRALAPVPRSERPLVFTKCGLVWKGSRVSVKLGRKSIRREVEESSRRLGVEALDLVQVHWPSDSTIVEAWRALDDLKKEGKVRHVGISNASAAMVRRIGAMAPVDCVQPPYSLLKRGIEADLLPHCLESDIGVIVYSPLESGLLSGAMTRERLQTLPDSDWRKRKGEEFREPNLSRNLAMAARVRDAAAAKGVPAAALAVAFALRHPAVTGAIVGARSAGQVEELARAPDVDLSEEESAALRAGS